MNISKSYCMKEQRYCSWANVNGVCAITGCPYQPLDSYNPSYNPYYKKSETGYPSTGYRSEDLIYPYQKLINTNKTTPNKTSPVKNTYTDLCPFCKYKDYPHTCETCNMSDSNFEMDESIAKQTYNPKIVVKQYVDDELTSVKIEINPKERYEFVKVVFCKECKKQNDCVCELTGEKVPTYGYCYWGERKDDKNV